LGAEVQVPLEDVQESVPPSQGVEHIWDAVALPQTIHTVTRVRPNAIRAFLMLWSFLEVRS
jgi:hypothetical protein